MLSCISRPGHVLDAPDRDFLITFSAASFRFASDYYPCFRSQGIAQLLSQKKRVGEVALGSVRTHLLTHRPVFNLILTPFTAKSAEVMYLRRALRELRVLCERDGIYIIAMSSVLYNTAFDWTILEQVFREEFQSFPLQLNIYWGPYGPNGARIKPKKEPELRF